MSNAETKRILLIDPSNFDVTLFKLALGAWQIPYELQVVNDSNHALRILLHETEPYVPHLIVLETPLPCLKASGFYQVIRKSKVLKSTPVVVITGSGNSDDRVGDDLHERVACIKKPSDFEEYRLVIAGLQEFFVNC